MSCVRKEPDKIFTVFQVFFCIRIDFFLYLKNGCPLNFLIGALKVLHTLDICNPKSVAETKGKLWSTNKCTMLIDASTIWQDFSNKFIGFNGPFWMLIFWDDIQEYNFGCNGQFLSDPAFSKILQQIIVSYLYKNFEIWFWIINIVPMQYYYRVQNTETILMIQALCLFHLSIQLTLQ